MREIIKYPNTVLITPTKKVTEIDDDLIDLLEEMHDIMVKKDGIGLAANQLGERCRVAIVYIDDESGLFEMINPRIIKKSGQTIDVEGCLSFPDIYGTVERFDDITVQYVDRDGYEVEIETSGYLSRVMQHEIEHLDGGLFTDKIIKRLSPDELIDYMEEYGYD
ncbi:peptide deformylase [Vagococcus sp. JNUCC 83]